MRKRYYLPILTLVSVIVLAAAAISLNNVFNSDISAALVAGAALPAGVQPSDCEVPGVPASTCESPKPAGDTTPWSNVIFLGLATTFFVDVVIVDFRSVFKAKNKKHVGPKPALNYAKQHSLSRL